MSWKKRIKDTFDQVEARELFDDGLDVDIHKAKVRTLNDAFMLGRLDAIREMRDAMEGMFSAELRKSSAGRTA